MMNTTALLAIRAQLEEQDANTDPFRDLIIQEIAQRIDDLVDLAEVLPPPWGELAEAQDGPLIAQALTVVWDAAEDLLENLGEVGKRSPRQLRYRARRLEDRAAVLLADEREGNDDRAARQLDRARDLRELAQRRMQDG